MAEEISVTTERVDDIPLLIAWMDRMGMAELTDECFTPHGNWQGISPGQTLTGWLAHILSEADHRLNRVQDWAGKRTEMLSGCLGVEVRDLDFSDDRLATVLDLLSDDESWASLEASLNRRTIRVYDLTPDRVRIDSTTASGYWKVSEDGLFQFGHSKDHRPDLPQLKVVLATLDPLGMPVATQVVSGDKADDPLYIPAIDQVREGIDRRGLLYIGDCKMMALETRAHLQAGGDYYLGLFSLTQVSQETLENYLKPIWDGEQPLTSVERRDANGELEKIAEGYECQETMAATVNGQEVTWVERRLIVRSLAHAKAAEAALLLRLEKAQRGIEALNERKQGKKHITDEQTLRQAAAAILKQYQVEDWLDVQVAEQVQERQVRKYGDRPAGSRLERQFFVSVRRNDLAL